MILKLYYMFKRKGLYRFSYVKNKWEYMHSTCNYYAKSDTRFPKPEYYGQLFNLND